MTLMQSAGLGHAVACHFEKVWSDGFAEKETGVTADSYERRRLHGVPPENEALGLPYHLSLGERLVAA